MSDILEISYKKEEIAAVNPEIQKQLQELEKQEIQQKLQQQPVEAVYIVSLNSRVSNVSVERGNSFEENAF